MSGFSSNGKPEEPKDLTSSDDTKKCRLPNRGTSLLLQHVVIISHSLQYIIKSNNWLQTIMLLFITLIMTGCFAIGIGSQLSASMTIRLGNVAYSMHQIPEVRLIDAKKHLLC